MNTSFFKYDLEYLNNKLFDKDFHQIINDLKILSCT